MKAISLFSLCLFFLQLIQAQNDNSYKTHFLKIESQTDSLKYFAGSWPPNIEDSIQMIKVTSFYDALIKDCESFAKEYPDTANIRLLLGDIYQMGHNLDIEGSWEKAKSNFEEAIDLNSDSPESYFSLGLLYVNTNPKYASKAENLFEKAIKLSKNNPDPYLYQGLAFAHMYQGDNSAAIKAIDEFLKLVPGDKQGIAFRNMVIKKLGK